MKLLCLLVLLNLFVNCNPSKCASSDKIYREAFCQKVSIVERAGKVNSGISADEFRNAILYLFVISGIQSKAGFSSTFGYASKTEYDNDLKDWRDWYEKNRCNLTDRYIDSAFTRSKVKRF